MYDCASDEKLFRSYSEVIPEKRRRAKHPSPSQALVGKRTPAKGQLSRTDGLSGSPDGSAPYWQPTGRAVRWGGGGAGRCSHFSCLQHLLLCTSGFDGRSLGYMINVFEQYLQIYAVRA